MSRRFRTYSSPICRFHKVAMVCRRTTPTVRYFYCPVPNCKCSQKVGSTEEKAVIESLVGSSGSYP